MTEPDGSRFFADAKEQARAMIGDPAALARLARGAVESGAAQSGAFAGVLDDFRAIVRLVMAYSRDHVRAIPDEQMVVAVAALIYVVSRQDLLPDDLPGGFLDDAYVVGWVIKDIRAELDAFRAWEEGR
ncbi:MAG: YkvA family protein [Nocardioides sp.]